MEQFANFAHVTGVKAGMTDERECGLTIRHRAYLEAPEQETPLFLLDWDGPERLIRQLKEVAATIDASGSTSSHSQH